MRGGLSAFAAVIVSVLGVAAAAADGPDPELLVRVGRETPNDLAALRRSGLPVVFETRAALFLRGTAVELRALDDAVVLDGDARGADHLVVGLRPDSDVALVRSLGPTLYEEDNLVLVRVPRGTPVTALSSAAVFVTRLPVEPVAAPIEPAAPAASDVRATAAADPLVSKIVSTVSPARIQQLWEDLTQNAPSGTRYTRSQGCRDAAQYCMDTYTGLGLPASFQNWSAAHAPNVTATHEGALRPADVYVVLGHLDDLPTSGLAPGADDNASGSVNVLESAHVLSCWGFEATLRFLNVTGEEEGLLGSEAWTDDAAARGETILGAIHRDMNGWEGDGDPTPENLDVDYNGPSEWLGRKFAECAATYDTGLVVDAFYCPSLSASDHYPFWTHGWPAICGITDNEDYCGHGGNYPYYHQSTDTIANCGDPSLFQGSIRTTVATLAELARPFKVTWRAAAYACGAPGALVLADRDLDLDPGAAETVLVEVKSTTEAVPETIALTERGLHAMLFEGPVPTSDGPPVAGDGILSVRPGDAMHVRYVDALDCDGATGAVYTDDARVDCAGPVISSVAERNVTTSSAEIVWTTDEPATSDVRWGTVPPPGGSASATGWTTQHLVRLEGLQACASYLYEVESVDEAGNVARDDDAGRFHRFETYGDFGSGPQPCHAGRVTIEADAYACGAALAVRLVDMDLGGDPSAIETATVEVTSGTETLPERIVLTETAPDSSTFTGSIPLGSGPAAQDGVLQSADGDVLTATYRDADDGTGAPALHFDSARLDCGAPVIRNLHVQSVTDQRMTVSFDTDEPADTRVEWGSTPALGQVEASGALVTAHQTLLNRLDLCQPVHVRVHATDALGNSATADLGGTPYAAHTWQIPGVYWRDTFEQGAAGWSLVGDWQAAGPQGRGGIDGGYPDPTAAYNGASVLGTDLTGLGAHPGDYEHGSTSDASTPEFDAGTWVHTKLLAFRRLNVQQDDRASIRVVERTRETEVWSSAGAEISQAAFTPVAYDLSALVDGKRRVAILFRMLGDAESPWFDDGVASGWNLDDVVLKDGSLPDLAACGGCGQSPSFDGLREAADVDACGGGGVSLSWGPAFSWGTGATGTYSVYRSEVPGFEPGASNRVAMGLTGLSWTDATAPADRTLHYLVIAENDETCGSGPANGGLVDPNRRSVAVTETTSRPVPGEVTGVSAMLVNHAHVRLSWPAVEGAASYRVLRSAEPVSGWTPAGETSSTAWEDLDQGGSASTWYYRVLASNACGEAGP